MSRPKKRRGKIRITKSARLVHKNDATRVEKDDTVGMKRMPAQMPRTVAPVFKVKVRKKK